MELVRCKSSKEARAKAADELRRLLKETREPVLFLSSGGSALELLEGLQVGPHITVSVLDERYSKDPAVNNFSQVMGRIKPTLFIDAKVQEGETLEQLASRFAKQLREWRDKNANGKIIITQGMGADGHTAGIMPHAIDENEKRWVVGYNAKEKNEYPLRLTTTFEFLRLVDHSVAYITGQHKKEALDRVLAREGTLQETPARIMREMKNVEIFTDIV